MKNRGLICSVLLILSACQSNLDENELNFNPYKKQDILIFQSDLGEKDTLKIGKISQFKNNAAQMSLFPDKLISLIVEANYNKLINGYPETVETGILEIYKVNGEPATIMFNLSTEGAVFYSKYNQTIADLLKQVKLTMEIGGNVYNDIVVIEPESDEYASREHFVSKIYWSLKDGYVRYDLLNGKTWELVSKN